MEVVMIRSKLTQAFSIHDDVRFPQTFVSAYMYGPLRVYTTPCVYYRRVYELLEEKMKE